MAIVTLMLNWATIIWEQKTIFGNTVYTVKAGLLLTEIHLSLDHSLISNGTPYSDDFSGRLKEHKY